MKARQKIRTEMTKYDKFRANIYFEKEEHEKLKLLSKRSGLPISRIVQECTKRYAKEVTIDIVKSMIAPLADVW